MAYRSLLIAPALLLLLSPSAFAFDRGDFDIQSGRATFVPTAPKPATAPEIKFTPSGQPYMQAQKAYTLPGAKSPVTLALKAQLDKPSFAAKFGKALFKSLPIVGAVLTLAELAGDASIDGWDDFRYDPSTKSWTKRRKEQEERSCYVHSNANECLSCDGKAKAAYPDMPHLQRYGSYGVESTFEGVKYCFMMVSEYYRPHESFGVAQPNVKLTEVEKWNPASPLDAEQAATSPNPVYSPAMEPRVNEIMNQPGTELPQVGAIEVTGPPSAEGETETKTSTLPDGRTQTATTTKTINITYQGDKISTTTTTTTTTTITNPDGTTSTTNPPQTTTTITDDPAPKKEQNAAMDALCTLFPNILACIEKGDPGTLDQEEIPNEEKAVSIIPTSGFQTTASCPSAQVVTVAGGLQLSFGWDLICSFATMIKPLVLAFAWLSAAFTFVGFARR